MRKFFLSIAVALLLIGTWTASPADAFWRRGRAYYGYPAYGYYGPAYYGPTYYYPGLRYYRGW